MYVQNAVRWSRFSAPQAWAGTFFLALLAFLVRHSLSPVLQPFGIFHFFILSCLVTQFFFGYRYALLGLALSIFLGEFFFVEPFASFSEVTSKDMIITFNFSMVTVAAIVLMETLQRNAYARALLLKVNDARYLISLQRENDRLHYARKSSEAWAVLELLIQDFDRILLLQHGSETIRLEPLFYQLTGTQPQHIQPEQWLDLIHPDDRAVLSQRFSTNKPFSAQPTRLTVRLCHTTNSEHPTITIQIHRFMFMNRPLWLLSQDELSTSTSQASLV